MIENNRIRALKDGIKSAEDMIGSTFWVFDCGKPLTEEDTKNLRDNLDEIKSFLLWLSQQQMKSQFHAERRNMKKFKRWIRNKRRKFLYVDELESSLSELNTFIQTSKSNLEYEIKRLDSLEYEIKRLDSKIDQKEYNTNIMYNQK